MNKIILLLFLFFGPALATSPLSLDWEKEYKIFEPPPGFKYYMGDIDWGQAIYVGTEDLLGMETELQLNFLKKKISAASLIFGPLGLDDNNCLIKYKEVVKWLNKKYGPFQQVYIEKDPIMNELIYASDCYPVQLGLYFIKNTWVLKEYTIKTSLIGDNNDFYIEVDYVIRNRIKKVKQKKEKNIIKRL